jgi:hypothetical protein
MSQALPLRGGFRIRRRRGLRRLRAPLGAPDALVLDIGDDVGALIIYADEACLGSAIDLTPVGAPQSHHIHTMIRRRRATDRDVIAGLFPELREGVYTVWKTTPCS